MRVCACTWVCVYVCLRACAYACMYVCLRVCAYACMYARDASAATNTGKRARTHTHQHFASPRPADDAPGCDGDALPPSPAPVAAGVLRDEDHQELTPSTNPAQPVAARVSVTCVGECVCKVCMECVCRWAGGERRRGQVHAPRVSAVPCRICWRLYACVRACQRRASEEASPMLRSEARSRTETGAHIHAVFPPTYPAEQLSRGPSC